MASKSALVRRTVDGRNGKRYERVYLHKTYGPAAYWKRLNTLTELMDFVVTFMDFGKAVLVRENGDELVKIYVIDEYNSVRCKEVL